ncbi:Zn-ribbon domain-containing OB-fold protein [Sulfobacillus harzensis]|uniref:Zn-ribbon domain-containing OB-fold protein n=1 Tax=Sulfobacillus harzensis TaxID=2729629 RepID=A0A7Y0Q3E7_9FIRM|nr:Zn-ribbon domain-containing OB-fold protein [Sulfobacillus harzensis]NMP23315.1 Zn-ribbon domain-containing OB-fold protein [Sulfobacillus harzensis]
MDRRSERPQPQFPEPDSQRFYAFCRERKLMYQQCAQCGTVVFYPRSHCTGCLSTDLVWHQSSGQGRIYSYTVLRRHSHPFFKQKLPYVLAFVDLAEGFRMLAEIVDTDIPAVHVGQMVSLRWLEAGDGLLPAFAPSSGASC